MKVIKSIIPIVFNIVVGLLFKRYMRYPLAEHLGYDMNFYIDGRVGYTFGVGSACMLFVIILLAVTIAWIIRNTNLYYEGQKKVKYRAIGIIIVLLIDGYWLAYYYDWYLLGFPDFLMEFYILPALEKLL